MKFEWDEIKNLPSCQTYRAKVPGGWLVNQISVHNNYRSMPDHTESMCFIPDPDHTWVVTDE